MRSGWNSSQRVEMLAGADELDRHAGDVLDRQRRAAAGVAVELGHDHAVELQRLVERLGAVDGVLAGHAVDDQVDLVRLDACGRSASSCVHQLVVDVQPAGRVENHDVGAVSLGVLARRVWQTATGSLAPGSEVDRHAELLAEHVQLVDGRGTLQVGGDQQRLARRALEQPAQLAAGGRLAGALQAAQHQHGRRRAAGAASGRPGPSG